MALLHLFPRDVLRRLRLRLLVRPAAVLWWHREGQW